MFWWLAASPSESSQSGSRFDLLPIEQNTDEEKMKVDKEPETSESYNNVQLLESDDEHSQPADTFNEIQSKETYFHASFAKIN